MHRTFPPRLAFLALLLILIGFNACQNDQILENNPSLINEKPSNYKEIPAGDIVPIEDNHRYDPSQATPRAELADIEDVPVVRVGGIVVVCTGTEDEVLLCILSRRGINNIRTGERLGVLDNLNTNIHGTNVTSCYTYGGQKVCGYVGKENLHPLTLGVAGNYRIQLTPKNPNRDFDVFVYRLTVLNKVITRTLVGYSTFSQGKTETVNIVATEYGVYDVVVDEYPNKNGQVGQGDGNYILSLSSKTDIHTTTNYNKNTDEVSYQFSLKSLPLNNQLYGWLFRKKQGATWLNLGVYNATNNFTFSCGSCDYLVSPIYQHINTGVKTEGTATVIRP
jgi:hypothetical protein